jgi:hypothetical protein
MGCLTIWNTVLSMCTTHLILKVSAYPCAVFLYVARKAVTAPGFLFLCLLSWISVMTFPTLCLHNRINSSPYTLQSWRWRTPVRTTLRLEIYRQSGCLGANPLETHDHSFFVTERLWPSSICHISLTKGWRECCVFQPPTELHCITVPEEHTVWLLSW